MSEPRRLRFSLATLLLVTTIAALGITITLLMREIGPLRAEVKKLREETGKLWIEDETKIHAIELPSDEEGSERTYKFRLALPPGKQYKVCCATQDIPPIGIAKAVAANNVLAASEWTVKVVFEPLVDPKTGSRLPYAMYRFECKSDDIGLPLSGLNSGVTVFEHKNDWLAHKETGSSMFTVEGMTERTTAFPIDEPVVLYRARAAKIKVISREPNGKPGSYSYDPIPEPCDGFMLWIEPVK